MENPHTVYMREWRKGHREEIKERDRRYYQAHKEKWIGASRAPKGSLLRKSQKFASYSRIRAAKFECDGNVTPAELRALVGPCHYCAAAFGVWDHVVPLCRGGDNAAANIVPACASCNRAKGKRTPEEWRSGISVARQWR